MSQTVAEMVAQTFDTPRVLTGNSGRIRSEKTAQQECANTPTRPDPLTELAESRMT